MPAEQHDLPVTPIFESPHGRLYEDDCLRVLPTKADGSIHLVFADLY